MGQVADEHLVAIAHQAIPGLDLSAGLVDVDDYQLAAVRTVLFLRFESVIAVHEASNHGASSVFHRITAFSRNIETPGSTTKGSQKTGSLRGVRARATNYAQLLAATGSQPKIRWMAMVPP